MSVEHFTHDPYKLQWPKRTRVITQNRSGRIEFWRVKTVEPSKGDDSTFCWCSGVQNYLGGYSTGKPNRHWKRARVDVE